jgi:hypothetical protein
MMFSNLISGQCFFDRGPTRPVAKGCTRCYQPGDEVAGFMDCGVESRG